MKRLIGSLLILFFSITGVYAASSPVDMLQQSANRLIAMLKQNQSRVHTDQNYVMALVSDIVLPHVDQTRMARSAINRTLWDGATAAQRQQFVKEFRQLVLRTYAGAFSAYTNEFVQFRNLRGEWQDQDTLTVQSTIVRPGKPAIPVDYSVTKTGADWKIYDFTVDGVSMVNSFSSQFASLNMSSLVQLTDYLHKHNSKVK